MAVGDHVFGEGTATLADHAVAPANQLAPLPTGLGFEEAAALPLAATTALLCLDAAEPAPGDSVLLNGASGGVGTFAIQLARSRGLHVTARRQPAQQRSGRTLWGRTGSSTTPRTTSPVTASGYDVVVDLVGNRGLSDLRRAVPTRRCARALRRWILRSGTVGRPPGLLVWGQVYGEHPRASRPDATGGAGCRPARPARRPRRQRAHRSDHRPTLPPRECRRRDPVHGGPPRQRQGGRHHHLGPSGPRRSRGITTLGKPCSIGRTESPRKRACGGCPRTQRSWQTTQNVTQISPGSQFVTPRPWP